MAIFKITKGNSFALHIQLQKACINKDRQMLEDVDIASVNDLEVCILCTTSRRIFKMPVRYTDVPNEVSIKIPKCIKEGLYDIIIRGKYDGDDLFCIEHGIFSVVCGRYHIPIGVVNGEQDRLYNAKYWIELAVSDKTAISYYGALATQTAATVNLEQLESHKGDLKGRVITINTTESNNIAWVVSPVPLLFNQAFIHLSMQETVYNDLYYYCSDELKPGESVLKII